MNQIYKRNNLLSGQKIKQKTKIKKINQNLVFVIKVSKHASKKIKEEILKTSKILRIHEYGSWEIAEWKIQYALSNVGVKSKAERKQVK